MPAIITLKNKANVDVIFTHQQTAGNVLTYASAGANLLDVKTLTLSVRNGAKVNRVVGKLSVPAIVTDASGVPFVRETLVGSFDYSVVKTAPTAGLEDFSSMMASLTGNAAVHAMVKTGATPV